MFGRARPKCFAGNVSFGNPHQFIVILVARHRSPDSQAIPNEFAFTGRPLERPENGRMNPVIEIHRPADLFPVRSGSSAFLEKPHFQRRMGGRLPIEDEPDRMHVRRLHPDHFARVKRVVRFVRRRFPRGLLRGLLGRPRSSRAGSGRPGGLLTRWRRHRETHRLQQPLRLGRILGHSKPPGGSSGGRSGPGRGRRAGFRQRPGLEYLQQIFRGFDFPTNRRHRPPAGPQHRPEHRPEGPQRVEHRVE